MSYNQWELTCLSLPLLLSSTTVCSSSLDYDHASIFMEVYNYIVSISIDAHRLCPRWTRKRAGGYIFFYHYILFHLHFPRKSHWDQDWFYRKHLAKVATVSKSQHRKMQRIKPDIQTIKTGEQVFTTQETQQLASFTTFQVVPVNSQGQLVGVLT